ncbi:hypothetical protein N9L68_06915 [bacterium]|nr:hypothetical protein [bacterium]
MAQRKRERAAEQPSKGMKLIAAAKQKHVSAMEHAAQKGHSLCPYKVGWRCMQCLLTPLGGRARQIQHWRNVGPCQMADAQPAPTGPVLDAEFRRVSKLESSPETVNDSNSSLETRECLTDMELEADVSGGPSGARRARSSGSAGLAPPAYRSVAEVEASAEREAQRLRARGLAILQNERERAAAEATRASQHSASHQQQVAQAEGLPAGPRRRRP